MHGFDELSCVQKCCLVKCQGKKVSILAGEETLVFFLQFCICKSLLRYRHLFYKVFWPLFTDRVQLPQVYEPSVLSVKLRGPASFWY